MLYTWVQWRDRRYKGSPEPEGEIGDQTNSEFYPAHLLQLPSSYLSAERLRGVFLAGSPSRGELARSQANTEGIGKRRRG